MKSDQSDYLISRRNVLKSSAAALGGSLLSSDYDGAEVMNVNTNSSPSDLKITDLRVATIVQPGPSPCPIIRIDTNQGVYGLGEVRDGASATSCAISRAATRSASGLLISALGLM